jgi:hypothetical protein
MKYTFYILTMTLLLTACQISLSYKDLTAFNTYNINDTLAFKNNFGEKKVFSIVSKTIINKGWDANTGWYNPQVAYVKYKDFSIPDTIYYDNSFLTIYQKTKTEIEETVEFNGFLGSIDRNTQQTSELKYLDGEQIYKIPKFDMTTVRDSTDIAYVYWTDKTGIIAYD